MTKLEISPDMNPEEVLAHYGVPGMQWGKRKSDTSSGNAPSRSERKVIDKAAKREENLKLTTSYQKPKTKEDAAILDARSRVNRAQQEYKDAKSTYKIEKKQIGKVAAKEALKEVGEKTAEIKKTANKMTQAEQSAYNSMVIGEAFTAIITRNPNAMKSDFTSNLVREYEAKHKVESRAKAASGR